VLKLKMKYVNLLWLTFFVVPGLGAEFDAKEWKFLTPIASEPGVKNPQFVRITLPGWVLANAREDLLDLRLVNEDGTEVPYVLQRAEPTTHEDDVPVRILNRGIDPGRYEQLVCDLGEQRQASNQIVLSAGARDFVRRAQVDGSADGSKWIVLRTDAYIFDQREQGRHYQNLRLTFPDSTYRYLRILISLDGRQPLNINEVQVRRVGRTEVEPERVPATIVRRSEDPKRKCTDLIVETAMGKQHLEECVLSVKQENFERSVTVSYQDHRGAWQEVGNDTIHRFKTGPVVDEYLTVPVQDLNEKRFRVRIWNGDSPPLDVLSVSMQRMPRLLVFHSSPADRYRLFFGNPEAEARTYDLGGAFEKLDTLRLPRVSLKAMTPNPSFSPRPVQRPWTERHPGLVWAALAIGVLLLAGLLLKTVRDAG